MNTNRSITVAIAITALLTTTLASKADPLGASCSSRLSALSAEWEAISFHPPSKPSQARVVGRNGHEISGGQYVFIQNRIRVATQACRAGDATLAEQEIGSARNVLARITGYDTVQTGSIK